MTAVVIVLMIDGGGGGSDGIGSVGSTGRR